MYEATVGRIKLTSFSQTVTVALGRDEVVLKAVHKVLATLHLRRSAGVRACVHTCV